jgi:hypothetical protein
LRVASNYFGWSIKMNENFFCYKGETFLTLKFKPYTVGYKKY